MSHVQHPPAPGWSILWIALFFNAYLDYARADEGAGGGRPTICFLTTPDKLEQIDNAAHSTVERAAGSAPRRFGARTAYALRSYSSELSVLHGFWARLVSSPLEQPFVFWRVHPLSTYPNHQELRHTRIGQPPDRGWCRISSHLRAMALWRGIERHAGIDHSCHQEQLSGNRCPPPKDSRQLGDFARDLRWIGVVQSG